MATSVKAGQVMATSAKINQVMATSVKTCQVMATSVKKCQVRATSVKTCQVRATSVKTCQVRATAVKACHVNGDVSDVGLHVGSWRYVQDEWKFLLRAADGEVLSVARENGEGQSISLRVRRLSHTHTNQHGIGMQFSPRSSLWGLLQSHLCVYV